MNSSETQPESPSDSSMTYFDPEQVDTSEQDFAVSLDEKAAPPAFRVEPDEDFTPRNQPESGAKPSVDSRFRTQPTAEAEKIDDAASAASCEDPEKQATAESGADWRELVSAKVSNYRSRRPRKERYPSLQLQFDAEPIRPPRTETKEEQPFEAPAAPEPQVPVEIPAMRSAPPILLESTARVLEFPRPVAPPPIRTDELADPVIDRPRIIEAPELLPPPPAMGGILMEPLAEPVTERRPGFEVPLQSATLNRRVTAALADATIVAGALAIFAYIALRIAGGVPPWRTDAIFCAGLFGFLWAAYQYAFLVFCGKTPGLLMARLEIRKFDGAPVSRKLRRWRALASILSLASVGLGYAWCFFDEDELSWHDRITHTHLAPRSSAQ